MKSSQYLIIILLLSYSYFSSAANEEIEGSENYDLPRVVSVSQKDYSIDSDFTLMGGFLPSDAFNKGYTVGLSYTKNFNSYMGWEILNAQYSFNSGTQLKDDVNSIPQVQLVNSGVENFLDYIT